MPQIGLACVGGLTGGNFVFRSRGERLCKIMYQALYRKFRPEVFEDFVGQEHIVTILKNQIAADRVAHAYLFCGTRGTGKTTAARLLAKALNCTSDGGRPCGVCEACRSIAAGSFMDVIEIDAASNNGVDNVRELREEVNYPPVQGRRKVYIIDEAHMLSNAAANAFLKTLEEPPEHVVFILATTEPERLPQTILSRCIRLDFRRLPEEQILGRFRGICEELGVQADEDALRLVAANADGSMRDGLSLLDRCLSANKRLTREDVLFLLGMTGTESCLKITDCIIDGNAGGALIALNDLLASGKEVNQFTRDWLDHLRSLLVIKYLERPQDVLNLSLENIERLRAQSARLPLARLDRFIRLLSEAMSEAKWSPRARIPVELAIVEMADPRPALQPAAQPAPAHPAGAAVAAEVRTQAPQAAPEPSEAAPEPPAVPESAFSDAPLPQTEAVPVDDVDAQLSLAFEQLGIKQ